MFLVFSDNFTLKQISSSNQIFILLGRMWLQRWIEVFNGLGALGVTIEEINYLIYFSWFLSHLNIF